jgi:two-component system osmolarity sensor histidine kinase EnvZ
MVRVSLFWRTFLLIAALVLFSLAAAWQMVRTLDRTPPEQRLAWEIASVVNLTRSALISSEGERRRMLLDELARDEGVRVALLEPGDRVEPLPPGGDAQLLERRLRALLGQGTRVAGRVNGEPALWVSFDIDGDGYWLAAGLERWTRQAGPPWWLVGSLAIAVSLVGGLLISRLVNRPLASLAQALGRVSSGAPAPPLPEDGPSEIAEVNRRFNAMATDLAALEADRAVALAGISHDIRTPLTRLRMEIELSQMSDEEKASMGADIERIDEIVGKFVEYARAGASDRDGVRIEAVDVGSLVDALRDAYRARVEAGELRLACEVEPMLQWNGDELDLARVLANLVENAMRYGRRDDHAAEVEIAAQREGQALVLRVSDRGPGLPESELQRLLRPFARLDDERSERGGSGLGLAIVQRIAQRHGGRCTLANRPQGGLVVRVVLPDGPVG